MLGFWNPPHGYIFTKKNGKIGLENLLCVTKLTNRPSINKTGKIWALIFVYTFSREVLQSLQFRDIAKNSSTFNFLGTGVEYKVIKNHLTQIQPHLIIAPTQVSLSEMLWSWREGIIQGLQACCADAPTSSKGGQIQNLIQNLTSFDLSYLILQSQFLFRRVCRECLKTFRQLICFSLFFLEKHPASWVFVDYPGQKGSAANYLAIKNFSYFSPQGTPVV